MSEISQLVVSSLRQMIREGQFQQGEQLKEVHISEKLGVSRTPVRLAFRTLEQEGLLEKVGRQGFTVRQFSRDDVICGLEIRGALEGLAARRLTEAGLTKTTRQAFVDCLRESQQIVTTTAPDADTLLRWSAVNQQFHSLIIDGAGSRTVADAIARNNHLPFASSDSITLDMDHIDNEFRKIQMAHLQHQLIFQAIDAGEGARAEMLMREHANISLRYSEIFNLPDALMDLPTMS